MSDAATLTAWSRLLLASLAEAGVSRVVISPGSRSTPFVLAAGQTPGLQIDTIIDERSAAFFALGQARVSGAPTLLLCTSGTAGAHYLPAVIEAAMARVPLLILTADRPPALQGCDAPQTIDQRGLFGHFARWSADLGLPDASPGSLRALRRVAHQAAHTSRWPLAGPVHLNAPARKPLEPAFSRAERDLLRAVHALLAEPAPAARPPQTRPSEAAVASLQAALSGARRPLAVAGPAPLGPPAETLHQLARLGVPVLVESTSQLRRGPDHGAARVGAFDPILRDPSRREALAPDLVIQLGGPPTSGLYERWMSERPGLRRLVVRATGWSDPQSSAEILLAEPAELLAALQPGVEMEAGWPEAWREAEARAWRAVAGSAQDPAAELRFAAAAVSALPEGALLVLGNSLPIRDVDAALPPGGPAIGVLCQRGANGIDGLVSGAAGAAAASGRPTLLLIGDVSLLHDVGGLAIAAEARGPLVIVVLNNRGGRIFEQLPVARSGATEADMARFTTPHDRDLSHAAALYGIIYSRVDSAEALSGALLVALAHRRATLIEARVTPDSYAAQIAQIQAALAEGA